MNFIKKYTQLIIGIIIGIVLVSGISVYANYNYFANDIKYTENKTVEQALNDLYDKKKNYIIPEGTYPITTLGNQIDVSKYQYVDTSGLQVESVSDTETCNSSGTITINNLPFKPSIVWIYFTKGNNDANRGITFAYDNKGYWWTHKSGTSSSGNSALTITENGFTVNMGSSWAGGTVMWTAVK